MYSNINDIRCDLLHYVAVLIHVMIIARKTIHFYFLNYFELHCINVYATGENPTSFPNKDQAVILQMKTRGTCFESQRTWAQEAWIPLRRSI